MKPHTQQYNSLQVLSLRYISPIFFVSINRIGPSENRIPMSNDPPSPL